MTLKERSPTLSTVGTPVYIYNNEDRFLFSSYYHILAVQDEIKTLVIIYVVPWTLRLPGTKLQGKDISFSLINTTVNVATPKYMRKVAVSSHYFTNWLVWTFRWTTSFFNVMAFSHGPMHTSHPSIASVTKPLKTYVIFHLNRLCVYHGVSRIVFSANIARKKHNVAFFWSSRQGSR